MALSAPGLQVGEVLAERYKLVEEIGRGGFGVVYRATQLGMNRDVAVKLLHAKGPASDGDEMRDRFKREAMMARNLNHPHTIRQYDFGETDDGMMYLVLEFLDGKNLVETIRQDGALGDARVRRLAEGALKSLAEAHAQGIVHRDLKPANIMLCNIYGERDYVKVLDFGIAKTVMGDTDLTAAGVALGSPRYMAPELLRGEHPKPPSDVYAIAITFAEAVMGKPLIKAENSVEAAQVQLSPDPLPIPDALRESELWPWLSVALRKDEKERYSSAEEMLEYLDASPEQLLERGADFGEERIQTTPISTSQSVTQPREQPDTDELATLNDDQRIDAAQTKPETDALDAPASQSRELPNDDEDAPTTRLEASNVDRFLKGLDDDSEPSTPDSTTSRVTAEKDFDTSPSRPALPTPTKRPSPPSTGNGPKFSIGNANADPKRETAPLQDISAELSPVGRAPQQGRRPGPPPRAATANDDPSGQDQSAPDVPRHELFADTPKPGGEEQDTEMVSLADQTRPEDGANSGQSGEAQVGHESVDAPSTPPPRQSQPEPAQRSGPMRAQFQSQPTPDSGTSQPGPGAETPGFGPQGDGPVSPLQGHAAIGGDPTGQQQRPAAADDGSNSKLLIGLAVLLLLGALGLGAVVFVGVRLLEDDPADAKSAQADPAVTNDGEQETRKVEFKIFTEPSKAALLIGGEPKGETPVKFSLPESRLPLEVDLELAEYEPRTLQLESDGSTTYKLILDRVAPVEEPDEPEEPEEVEEAPPEDPPEETVEEQPDPKPRPKPRPKPKPRPAKDDELIPIWD